ncbi:MAG: VCBS repeat-containing protein [Acidobacteriia bacterium]|nr:VCBS repeat-containing protein [Terriglobia bacterium]
MRNFVTRLCLVVAVMCFLISGSLWATGFPKIPQYPIGHYGTTTTGDFNGDGKLDLVVLSQCSPAPCSNSTIVVILGNGNGRFQRPISSTTTGFPEFSLPPVGIVVGDFNGDRKLDIAFISNSPQLEAIAVALGNGDGTFDPTTTYPMASSARRLSGGDVNGDGKFDLILSHIGGLTVFLGNGDGTFRALPDAPGACVQCVLADVNHDSKLDIIGGYIQLGNGDGTFQEAQPISGAGNSPVVADFNGDGNLDVAAYLQKSVVNLYFGNGDGTFQPPVYRWTSPMDGNVLAGDFNGDGKPDLLTTRGSEIDIFLNKGNAKFWPPVGYLMLGGPVLADLNGDRMTDVIFLRRTASDNAVAIPALAGVGGTFSFPRSYFLPGGGYASSMMAGDLNNDGKLDLVEVNQESATWRGGHLNRLLGNGDGTFKWLPDLLTGGRTSFFGMLCDLNHDGKLDVLVASGDSINVRLGLGDGNFQSPLNYPVQSSWPVVAVADFNGDGIPDVAVNRMVWGPGGILLGNGDGTFRGGASLPAEFDWLVAADFNGDGKQDLGVATPTAAGIMLGNGDGTFRPISGLRSGHTERLLAADFNLDGKLDLAAVGTTASGNSIASVYLGNGDGTLQLARNTWIHGGVSPGGAVAADFNRDGKVDLAVSLISSAQVALLPGDGAGRFQLPTFYFGGGGRLVAGDFDRNGTEDLAVITSERTVAVLLNE